MSESEKDLSQFGIFAGFMRGLSGIFKGAKSQEQSFEPEDVCCDGIVHVAYRGLSDDRLYLAHKRKWSEVKFFKQRNLRVFCAGCRRRLL